jgi:hypothetical protein
MYNMKNIHIICTCIYVLDIYVCIYVHVYIYIYVCIYIHLHTYIYICIHLQHFMRADGVQILKTLYRVT